MRNRLPSPIRVPSHALTWAVAILFLMIVARRLWSYMTHPTAVDFYYFWHSAGLVVRGQASAAYAVHLSPVVGELTPLAYPPPFLLFIAPLGWMRLEAALIVWLGATGLLYLFAARHPVRLALTHPPAAYNALVGQTGFLTASIMLVAAHNIRSRPLLGGAIFGLMVIKPHLAVLVPLALIAAKQWRALAGAALSSIVLTALAAAVFGLDAYRGFFAVIAQYAVMLQRGSWEWFLLASPYAFVMWFGAHHLLALFVHIVAATFAAYMVWSAWREDWDSKIPVLGAAACLIPPYLFTYDAVLLIAPLGFLAARNPAWAALVWGLSLPPLAMALGKYTGPNTIPLAALMSLIALYRLERGRLLPVTLPRRVDDRHSRVSET